MITSPELVQSVFKNSKTLSFDPLTTYASKKLLSMTDTQMEFLSHQRPGSTDEYPLTQDTKKKMHATMAGGSSLMDMNSRALNRFAECLNDVGTSEKPMNLSTWLRDCFTLSIAAGLYGPSNPIEEDNTLIQYLWYGDPPHHSQHVTHFPHSDFEHSLGLLVLDLFPSLTIPSGVRARNAFRSGFKSYYDRKHDRHASALIRGRREVLCGGGMTTDDLATFEIGIVMAAAMNSNPGIFWLICFIFADPSLLADIRKEISSIVEVKTGADGSKQACMDFDSLQKCCPLLVSTWQETLRLTDAPINSRIVLEDTMLNNTYLLKKGSVIQMPCGPMHTSSSIWGSDSNSFDATRFLKTNQDKLERGQRKSQKMGFAPFGGGAVLCPGRHFATMEILGAAATLAVGYEIRIKDGGVFRLPKMKKQGLGVQVKHPQDDIKVLIRRREEFEGCKWTYYFGEGLAGEDMVFQG